MKKFSVNQAIHSRIDELLSQRKITAYRLAENSGISHARLWCILHDKVKTVTLSAVILLAQGFNMGLTEFLDSPFFNNDNLELE